MPRPSTIETHPERERIETAIRNGTSYRNVAEQFGLSVGAVARQAKRMDIQAEAAKRLPAAVIEQNRKEGTNLADELERIRGNLQTIQQIAMDKDQLSVAIQALNGQLKAFDTWVKIAAEERARQHTDLAKHPEFQRFQAALSRVLRRHPGLHEELERELEEGR